MKKLVLFPIVVIVCLITACTSDIPSGIEAIEDCDITSCIVSADAINLSKQAPSVFNSENSRAIERTPDFSQIYPITKVLSRSSDVDTALFVINYKNEQGFSIITASKENPELIAYVPEGSYNPEIGTDNAGFNLYLNTIMRVLEKDSTDHSGDLAIDLDGKQRKIVRDTAIQYGPCTRMDRTRWGQDRIFGQFCPNGLAGCAPLAITAIIGRVNNYLGKETRFYYTYPDADISYEDIDWTEFMRHQQSYAVEFNNVTCQVEVHAHICWQSNPEESHKTIGRVIRQIGHELNATYDEFETTAFRQNYSTVLKRHLPEADITDLKEYTPPTIMREIDKGLVLMRADPAGNYSGHAWIADGYYYYVLRDTYYERHYTETKWTIVKQVLDAPCAYSHFLWGYNGVYDGWYSSVVFDPKRIGQSYINPQYIAVRF